MPLVYFFMYCGMIRGCGKGSLGYGVGCNGFVVWVKREELVIVRGVANL